MRRVVHYVSRDAGEKETEGDILDAVGALGVERPILHGTLDAVR